MRESQNYHFQKVERLARGLVRARVREPLALITKEKCLHSIRSEVIESISRDHSASTKRDAMNNRLGCSAFVLIFIALAFGGSFFESRNQALIQSVLFIAGCLVLATEIIYAFALRATPEPINSLGQDLIFHLDEILPEIW